MIIIGIDPGMKGAVVAINGKTRELLRVSDCPTLKIGKTADYDIPEMASLLRGFSLGGPTMAILEQAQSMPDQGVASMFATGRGYGIWLGILGALEIPYQTVRPCVWTRRLFKGLPGNGKERGILFASRTFPGIELVPKGCRKPRDGRSDAACLAYYGALLVAA